MFVLLNQLVDFRNVYSSRRSIEFVYFVVLCKHRSTVCVQDQIVGSGCLMRRCCCCIPGLRTFWKRWKQSAAWPIYTVPLRELNRLRGVNAAVVNSISSALKKVLCGSSHRLSGFYVDLIMQFDFKSRTLFCLFDFNLSLSWNRCKKMCKNHIKIKIVR